MAEEVAPGDFAPYQSLFNTYPINEALRRNLLDSLRSGGGIEETRRILNNSYGLGKKFSGLGKSLVALLPYRFVQLAKYIYYHLAHRTV